MFQATQEHAHIVGAIIEDRAYGISANSHARMQASIINTDHDDAQHKGEQEKRWEEQAEQEQRERVIARQVAAEVIGVREVAAQGGLKDGKDTYGRTLLLNT